MSKCNCLCGYYEWLWSLISLLRKKWKSNKHDVKSKVHKWECYRCGRKIEVRVIVSYPKENRR